MNSCTAFRYPLPKMNTPYPLPLAQGVLENEGQPCVQPFRNVTININTDKTRFWHLLANCWFIKHPIKLLVESNTNLQVFSSYEQA
jgi:hypothetical protein